MILFSVTFWYWSQQFLQYKNHLKIIDAIPAIVLQIPKSENETKRKNMVLNGYDALGN